MAWPSRLRHLPSSQLDPIEDRHMDVQLRVAFPARVMPPGRHDPIRGLDPTARGPPRHLRAVAPGPAVPGVLAEVGDAGFDAVHPRRPQRLGVVVATLALQRRVEHRPRLGRRERGVGVVARLAVALAHGELDLGPALGCDLAAFGVDRCGHPLGSVLEPIGPRPESLTGYRVDEIFVEADHRLFVDLAGEAQRLGAGSVPAPGRLAMLGSRQVIVPTLGVPVLLDVA